MRISEAYRKLDRRLIIAVKQSEGVFRVISTLQGRTPAYIFEENGEGYLQMYFDKEMMPHGSLAAIVARNDVTDRTYYYTLAEKMENPECIDTIHRIMATRSVTMNDSYLMRGELFLDFRFHNSVAADIIEILSGNGENPPAFRLESMRESEGLRERMMGIHRESQLSLVRYSVDMPDSIGLLEYLKSDTGEVVAEVENRHIPKGGARIILYSTKPLDFSGLTEISKTDNVYETYADDLGILRGGGKDRMLRIPRLAFFLTKEHGRLVDTTIVQSTGAGDYVSYIMSMGGTEHDLKPIVEHYSALDEKVWEWL